MPRWSANVEACFQPNRRGARKSLAPLRGGPMVMRIAPIRVICFCLLAACGALCQKSADLIQELRFDGSNSTKGQGEGIPTSRSLPDAPSVRPPTPAEEFRTFFAEARSPLTLTAVGDNARVIRETDLDHVKAARRLSYTDRYKASSIEGRSGAGC